MATTAEFACVIVTGKRVTITIARGSQTSELHTLEIILCNIKALVSSAKAHTPSSYPGWTHTFKPDGRKEDTEKTQYTAVYDQVLALISIFLHKTYITLTQIAKNKAHVRWHSQGSFHVCVGSPDTNRHQQTAYHAAPSTCHNSAV